MLLRWIIKWLGLAACLVILVAFAFSTRRTVTWTNENLEREIGLTIGAVYVDWRPDDWHIEEERYPGLPGWGIAEYAGSPGLYWWISWYADKHWVGFSIPLWMPFVLLAVPTSILWHRDRRLILEAIDRWKVRLCPRQPKRMTIRLVVVCSLLHAIGVIFCANVLFAANGFFLTTSAIRDLAYKIILWAWRCLFLGSPLCGVLWASVWVRMLNRLFVRMCPHCCVKCGYNLRGNVSGTCPECGRPWRR